MGVRNGWGAETLINRGRQEIFVAEQLSCGNEVETRNQTLMQRYITIHPTNASSAANLELENSNFEMTRS